MSDDDNICGDAFENQHKDLLQTLVMENLHCDRNKGLWSLYLQML